MTFHIDRLSVQKTPLGTCRQARRGKPRGATSIMGTKAFISFPLLLFSFSFTHVTAHTCVSEEYQEHEQRARRRSALIGRGQWEARRSMTRGGKRHPGGDTQRCVLSQSRPRTQYISLSCSIQCRLVVWPTTKDAKSRWEDQPHPEPALKP